MKNKGTLVAAPITINDSEDLYPSAFQREIKGGHHKRSLYDDLAPFPNHLKEAGMTCYIAENGKTYQLANDLITWNIFVTPAAGNGGGTTEPGTGGNDNATATIISGNFGEWKSLPAQSANIFDKQVDVQYKADLVAFPNRSIVYLIGQFGLKSDFVGKVITLGTLPASARPKSKIKKWMACKGIELYLIVETGGAVKLESKDNFNLPVTTGANENDPFYIDLFFNPDIAVVEPTVYTYTRTQDFERDNCAGDETGSVVPFSKTYTSNVSESDAQNIALSDNNYEVLGQANANQNGSCDPAQVEHVGAYIEVTYPGGGQNGSYNVFGFKIVSEKAIEESVSIHFEAIYEGVGGGAGDRKYTDTLTLSPGSTEYDPGNFPAMASPASSDPTITILSSSPGDGEQVTEYGTGKKLRLSVAY